MAETPPPFNPTYNAPKKTGTNPIIWILVALAAFCCLCSVGGYFTARSGMNEFAKESKCFMTMGLAQSSIKKYVEENGVFPEADSWQADIAPYYEKSVNEAKEGTDEAPGFVQGFVGSILNFQDITTPLSCHDSAPITGIAYNSSLAGKTSKDIDPNTVVVYENDKVELNNAAPYVKKDDNPEIKFSGKTRPYYELEWDEDFQIDRNGSNASINIKTE